MIDGQAIGGPVREDGSPADQCRACGGMGCEPCNWTGDELEVGVKAGVCTMCQAAAPPGRLECFGCVPVTDDDGIDYAYRFGRIAQRFASRTDRLDYCERASAALFSAIQGRCLAGGIGGIVAGGRSPAPVIYVWRCPWCDPLTGKWADGGVCHHCHGSTLTNDVDGWDEAELTPAPVPPAVMRRPCVDCALRPGSPESETGTRITAEAPFYCHHGLVRVGDGYASPATVGEAPLGAMLCGGWYAIATGRPLPAESFRDPGGADRQSDAPADAGQVRC